MHTVDDCDLVFDVLTRGPFPNGSALDDEVAAHLAVCHDCRVMAETLRPAVDFFHECHDGPERNPLPKYVESADRLAGQIMEAIQTIPTQRDGVRSPQKLARSVPMYRVVSYVLAPALLLVLAGLFFRGFGGGANPASADGIQLETIYAHELLRALLLPKDCRISAFGNALHERDASCCTKCHIAAVAEPVFIPCMTRLSVSCNACHAPHQSKFGCCQDCHATPAVDDVRYHLQLTSTCETCHKRVPG